MIINKALAWTVALYVAIGHALALATVMIDWMIKKIGLQATIAMVRRV